MERPFGSYEKASEAVLPRLLKSRGSVQQIQHQRENDERERDPLGHLRQSTVKRFRLTLGEEGLRAAGDSAGQTGAFPDWSSTTTIRKIPARSWMMVKARTRPFTRFNPFYSKRKLFCA